MQKKFYMIFVLILLSSLLFSKTNYALACLSITDDLNFPNPTLNASFTVLPDISPFNDCWNATFRIRSSQSNWRLIANRNGPNPARANGNPEDYVKASDLNLDFKLQNFGMATPNGAILVSPFSSTTDLSSIQSGTFIVSGINKTGGSCSINNQNFYELTKKLCLFHDFLFNEGNYNGNVSFLLIAP